MGVFGYIRQTEEKVIDASKTPGGNGWGYMWSTDRVMVAAMEEG